VARPSVIIVGGGVVGCSLAYYLAGAGCPVSLLERGQIASGASGAAAGILGPLAESAEPGPFLDLAVAGLRAFQEDAAGIEDTAGLRVEYAACGVLRPAEDRHHAAALQRSLSLAADVGLPASWLGPDELHRLEPALAPGLVGALYSPEEGQVQPRRLTLALAHGAARRGAVIREGAAVHCLARSSDAVYGVETTGGETLRADVVVLAGGAWSRFLPGTEVAVRPVRGQYVLLRRLPQPVRRIIYRRHGYVVPRLDGTLYVGATEEPEAGYHAAVTATAQRDLLASAIRLIPALAGADVIASGAGLRPGSPDGLPILGWLPGVSGLAVATGHFRNGVLLSLITGRLLTELIVYGRTSLDLAPFSPARCAGDLSAAGARMGEA